MAECAACIDWRATIRWEEVPLPGSRILVLGPELIKTLFITDVLTALLG